MPKEIAWGGIDPGVDGCLCLLTKTKIAFHDIKTDKETAAKIDQWNYDYNIKFMIEIQSLVRIPETVNKKGERVAGFVGGVKLIDSYAFLRGCLVSLNCNWHGKTAKQWQKIIPGRLKTVGLTMSQRKTLLKQRSIDFAIKLYPAAAGALSRKMDHNRAEALLMAHFVRKTEL